MPPLVPRAATAETSTRREVKSMTNPQQPELRRSEKGETVEQSQQFRIGRDAGQGNRPHGTDKGGKGGGEGGGVPPDQQSPYPT
jgi:hypothetical protein